MEVTPKEALSFILSQVVTNQPDNVAACANIVRESLDRLDKIKERPECVYITSDETWSNFPDSDTVQYLRADSCYTEEEWLLLKAQIKNLEKVIESIKFNLTDIVDELDEV